MGNRETGNGLEKEKMHQDDTLHLMVVFSSILAASKACFRVNGEQKFRPAELTLREKGQTKGESGPNRRQ